MPTPGQPVHSDHLAFAVFLHYHFFKQNPTAGPKLAETHAVDTAKELILAQRAWKKTRVTRDGVNEAEIIKRMRALAAPYGLKVELVQQDNNQSSSLTLIPPANRTYFCGIPL